MSLAPRNKLPCNRLARGCQPGSIRSMSCSSIAAPACPIGKPDAHFTGLRVLMRSVEELIERTVVLFRAADCKQPLVKDVANPRRKAEAQRRAQSEHVGRIAMGTIPWTRSPTTPIRAVMSFAV